MVFWQLIKTVLEGILELEENKTSVRNNSENGAQGQKIQVLCGKVVEDRLLSQQIEGRADMKNESLKVAWSIVKRIMLEKITEVCGVMLMEI